MKKLQEFYDEQIAQGNTPVRVSVNVAGGMIVTGALEMYPEYNDTFRVNGDDILIENQQINDYGVSGDNRLEYVR